MKLTLQDLEKGRRIAALVVRHCGEKYFPLFDRFDREVENRRSAAARLDSALAQPARPSPDRPVHPH